MELLPHEIKTVLPPLHSQESSRNPIAHAKFFTPDAGWTWFVTEGSGEDGDWLLFGYVIGLEEEWGYFLLSEIEEIRGPLGLPVERDLWFHPAPIDEVLRRERPGSGEATPESKDPSGTADITTKTTTREKTDLMEG